MENGKKYASYPVISDQMALLSQIPDPEICDNDKLNVCRILARDLIDSTVSVTLTFLQANFLKNKTPGYPQFSPTL